MAEHFVKASLVVVEPLLALVVDGTDVHDYVASVKDARVPSALHVCREEFNGMVWDGYCV